jgi:hypothetical protein
MRPVNDMPLLKYIFTATFQDGETIKQSADDISTLDPTRSSFYDVTVKGIDKLSTFELEDADRNTFRVDLSDGSFVVNGARFRAGDPRTPPLPGAQFRLIYFRRHTHTFNADCEELRHVIEFVVGWQTTADCCNVQQTIILT